MELNEKVRLRIIRDYCILIYFIAAYKLFTGQFLFQANPAFFFNKLDVSTWLVQLTNLHKVLLNNQTASIIFDALFYGLPILFYFGAKAKSTLTIYTGAAMLVINFFYATVYCSYPTVSIEVFSAFILFPLLFITSSLKSFWFVFQGLRYFFLYFFASAGIWKLVQGGIFYTGEMSGILLTQHKELFVLNSPTLLLKLYQWLITHPAIGYLLYFLATLFELLFITGFMTKRFDRFLCLLFLAFIIMDYVIMQINYIPVLPFLITLFYSRYQLNNYTKLSYTEIKLKEELA